MSSVSSLWGTLKIYVGNVDVTRTSNPHSPANGVPTEIGSFGSQEPFGDDVCTLVFHGLSARNVYGGEFPSGSGSVPWLYDWAPVKIVAEIAPVGMGPYTTIILWEGNVASFNDDLTEQGYSVTADCTGSFYQMNTVLHPPAFDNHVADIGKLIYDEVFLQVFNYGCGLQLMDMVNTFNGLTGVNVRKTGAWDPVVSGWIASLLGMAYTSPRPNGLCIALEIPSSWATQPGYWVLSTDGLLLEYHKAPYWGCPFAGSAVGLTDQQIGQNYEPDGQLNAPITDMASVENSTPGYWLVAEDGGVFAYGGAQFYGSMAGTPLLFRSEAATIVGTPSALSPEIDCPGITAADEGARVTGPGMPTIVLGALDTACYVGDVTVGSKFNASSTRVIPTDLPSGSNRATTIEIEELYVGIVGTATGLGYWITTILGHVYAFGDAVYHGGAPVLNGPVVDFIRSHSGAGYYLLAADGGVFAFGDAVFHGSGTGLGSTTPFSGMALHPDGGYWLVNQAGQVYALPGSGVPPYYGNAPGALAGPITGITYDPMSGGYYMVGSDGGVFAEFGGSVFYGSVPDGSARQNQWTIETLPGRKPILRLKDSFSVHYTYECGQAGVVHSLTRDLTTAPNAIYGEGISPITKYLEAPNLPVTPVEYLGQWRNTIYPRQQTADPPVWPGTVLSVGSTGPDVQTYQTRLYQSGYTTIRTDGIFDQNTANVTSAFQLAAGITVNGMVGAQTWSTAFNVGGGGGLAANLAPYFSPLSIDPSIAPFLLNADGSDQVDLAGNSIRNPGFDWRKRRVEKYENFGNYVNKSEGLNLAGGERRSYSVAPWTGTLTIAVDNTNRHRLQMRAGMNILYRNYQGRDLLLHVSKVAVNPNTLTVTATVDSAFRDATFVDAILNGDRTLTDPDKRPVLTSYQSGVTKDVTAAFDAENGGGRIPRHAIAARTWQVYRVPVGTAGTIVHTEFSMETPAKFSIGIFPLLITPTQLSNLFAATLFQDLITPDPGNPLGYLLNGQNPWDTIGSAHGLLVAWGWAGSAAGFWPDSDPGDGSILPSGLLIDDSALVYQAVTPPWVYVAEYCEIDNVIQGQLYPSAPSY